MKAIVWTNYGPPDVLQLREVDKPVPKDNQVLIKIHATTATAGDCELRSFKIVYWIWLPLRIFSGILKPKRITILGQDFAGEIESVGKNVKRYRKGDQVYGVTGMGFGGYAEYLCLHEKGTLAIKPSNMTYEEAAPVPTWASNALHFLSKANIQNGEKVVIIGGAGSIGTFGVQIAKSLGAQVTAVDSTNKLDVLRAIGADHVIDYTLDDFTRNGETYDVILDVVGKSPYSRCLKSLNQNGRYLLANTGPMHMLRGIWTSLISSKQVLFELANPGTKDFNFLRELAEACKIKSVIDRCYPLAQTAEAHRYVETGQKAGNVVITVGHDNPV